MNQFFAMIWKEMTQIANRGRFATERFVVALAGAAMFVFAAYSMIYSAEDVNYERLALFGRYFLIGSSTTFTIILSAGAMLFASAVVVSEHLRRTLVFLLVTPLSAASILGAKLASTCARVFSAVVVCVPLFALLTAFGGFDWVMVAGGAMTLLSNVILYASLGLMASATSKGFFSAIVRAVVYTILWQFVSLWIVGAAALLIGRGAASSWIMSLNPVLASAGMARGMPFVVSYLVHFSVNTGIASLFFLIAIRSFRRNAVDLVTPAPRARKRPEPKGPSARRWWARRLRLSGVTNRFFGPGILSKELSSVELAPALMLPVIILWLWAMTAAFIAADRLRDFWDTLFDVEGNLIFFGIEGTLLVMILAGLGAARIASEHEAGTFKTLGLSPLGGLRILAGKGAAILIAQMPAIILVLAHALWLVLIRAVPRALSPVFIATVLFAFCNAVLLGLYVSLPSRRIAHAAVAAVCLFAGGSASAGLFTGIYEYYVDSPYMYIVFLVLLAAALVALLIAVLRYGSTAGLGTGVHVLSYLAVLGCSTVLMSYISSTELVLQASMPFSQASVLYWGPTGREVFATQFPAGLLVLPGQVALAVWMAGLCMFGFEAQLRRT